MAEKKYDSKHRLLKTGENQMPDGRYRFRTKIDGREHVIYAKTLSELRDKEKELEKKRDSGADLERQKMTVDDFAQIYLKNKKRTVQRTTFSSINYYYNKYCKDELGNMKIVNVKKSHIKSFYLSIMERNLSISTLQKIDCVLAPIFELALDDDVIFKNPVRKVCAEIKRETHAMPKKVNAPTPDQMKALIEYTKDNPIISDTIKNLVNVLFGTGMRIGEVTALTWDNVDFKNNKVTVCRSIGYIKENGHAIQIVKEPKTDAGKREIPMIGVVRASLLAERERQMAEGIPQPTLDGVTNFCFLSRRNTVFVREAVNVQIKRMQEMYNLNAKEEDKIPRFSTHAIRHSFATALCQSVDDLKAIQEIMGHTDIQTTLNVYADATKEAKIASMDAFEEKIGLGRGR